MCQVLPELGDEMNDDVDERAGDADENARDEEEGHQHPHRIHEAAPEAGLLGAPHKSLREPRTWDTNFHGVNLSLFGGESNVFCEYLQVLDLQ